MRFTKAQVRDAVAGAVAERDAVIERLGRSGRWSRRRCFAYGYVFAGAVNAAVYYSGLLDWAAGKAEVVVRWWGA